MKIAIFSDIHGNLPAFEKMLKDAGNVDQYICLGDVVNYGPWSNECVEFVSKLKNCILISGNHEKYFLERKYQGNNDITRTFFYTCIKKFTEFKSISKFRKNYYLEPFFFVHTINNRNIYPNSKVSLDRNYIIGHSHHQFKLKSNKYVLYNVGSIGQNRKYINVIDYLLYYPKKPRFEFRNLVYDVDRVLNEMKRRKYPLECINYYKKKKRI